MPAAQVVSQLMVWVHSPAFRMLALVIGRQGSKEVSDGRARAKRFP